MATVKPKLVGQLKMHGDSLSHSRTDISVRDVETTTDEPVERGGTNMGMSPVETLMAALIGCTNVISHKIAEKNDVHFDAMTIDADITFDRRGTQLMDDVRVPFPEITLTINVTTSADDAAIETIKTDLGKYCPVAKVLREAGTDITEIWNVTRP